MCSKCKQILPVSNFRFRNKSQNIYHSQCKECEKARDKIYYANNLNRRESVRATADFQKARNIKIVDEAKQCGCKKCGEKRSYVLDFHHRDNSLKQDTINHMLKSASAENLINEINKCDVLCANCHREFHYLNTALNISYNDWINGQIAYEV